MDQRHFFLLISVVAFSAAVFSPAAPAAIYLTRFVVPDFMWESLQVLIYVNTLMVGVGLVLIGGVPAALFQRLAERPSDDDITMMVWLGGVVAVAYGAHAALG